MAWSGEDSYSRQLHGQAEELITEVSDRPLRPLTMDEKLAATTIDVESRADSSSSNNSDRHADFAAAPSNPHEKDSGIFATLRKCEATLDRVLGIESEAIDRKLPEDRQRPSLWSQVNMAALWASGVMNLSCFATGFLGTQVYRLSLAQSIVIVIFGSLLGAAISGFCATLGPATGLRQISIGRYSMGWYPNKIVAALNTIQQLGWSAVGCITGGLALTAVSNGSVSIVVGIIIIAVISLIISFIGLRAILVYEKYAWFIYLIIFIIIYAETGRFADPSTPAQVSGATLSGNVLSFLAIVYGSSASWTTIASDYYAHYPVDVSRNKVFVLTTLGIALPTAFAMSAGCCVASAFTLRPDWGQTYNDEGLGYLVQEMLYPRGFADFLLVLLVLSGINMNILNTYSAAISCQQFARPFARVPRFIWTFMCFGVIIALALAGRNNLLEYLQNFLSLLGYWCTSYFVIVFTEHYFFRRGRFTNYDLDGWNDPARLPIGLAGFGAFALGIVAWVMGMAETWYLGPLAKLIGENGGDVANEFTFVVTGLSYVPLRWLELKYVGR